MTLISFNRKPHEGMGFEQLWREAEKIGRVDVDHPGFSDEYRVQIRFYSSAGSTIWAAGKSADIVQALGLAIQEAQRLA